MVLNSIFNNISAILWWSVLLLEESGVPGESHWPVSSYCQTWSHHELHSNFSTLVAIGTDCTGSCKSNYHTITTTTALPILEIFENLTCKNQKLSLFLTQKLVPKDDWFRQVSMYNQIKWILKIYIILTCAFLVW